MGGPPPSFRAQEPEAWREIPLPGAGRSGHQGPSLPLRVVPFDPPHPHHLCFWLLRTAGCGDSAGPVRLPGVQCFLCTPCPLSPRAVGVDPTDGKERPHGRRNGQVSMSTGFGPDRAWPLELLGDLEQARQLPDCERAVVIPIVLH